MLHKDIVVRRHPLSFYTRFFLFVFIGILPAVLFVTHPAQVLNISIDPLLVVLFGALFYLYIGLFILYTFFDHYLDIWMITEHELVHSEQATLFNRTTAKQELARIQDVEVQVSGLLPTLFDYGNIYVQTAGTQERITFEQVPHPHKVADSIMLRVHAIQKKA